MQSLTFIKNTRSSMYFIELLDDIEPYEKICGWKMRAKKYPRKTLMRIGFGR